MPTLSPSLPSRQALCSGEGSDPPQEGQGPSAPSDLASGRGKPAVSALLKGVLSARNHPQLRRIQETQKETSQVDAGKASPSAPLSSAVPCGRGSSLETRLTSKKLKEQQRKVQTSPKAQQGLVPLSAEELPSEDVSAGKRIRRQLSLLLLTPSPA